ncbi:MAG: RidA family protein [Bacillota bacterium]|uniref:RidA family protein n=1 Tax=Desulforudis sp. DRI-14 TaxID=3459793 RepID=UPI00347264A7
MSYEDRLVALNVTLPEAPKPVAAYVAGLMAGNMIYTSGQLPLAKGELQFCGKLGDELTVEQGAEAARLCAINCLAVVRSLAGSLDRVERVVKVTGYVASAPGFTAQPQVLNGASEFIQQVFGEAGRHARSAVGVTELPLGAPVEVEMIVRLKQE